MSAILAADAPAPVLEAIELRRYYSVRRGLWRPAQTVRALDGVSFALPAGRTLAVVGESGCGKSTLARQLTLIETPSAGELRLLGEDCAQASREERRLARRKVQMVFQNPYGSLNPRQTIGRILAEPLVINTRLGAGEREARVRALMERVGLRPEHYGRYPHMFSGGQRQRVAIARALMLRPAVVVADEPVSALDVSIQAQVLNLLRELQDEMGVAYVFISHDLAVVHHIADEVLVMYLGRPVEQGTAAEVFARPLHPYSRALLAAAPRLAAGRQRGEALHGELPSPLDPPAGCAFHTRCPHATGECAQQRPALRPLGERLVACHHVERIG
ncbi:dipeptide ABC transporter ATP-binding protein [Plasticicumulans acidivorans]|uniref:Dipeptide transport system ATP-binding protein n=1 Tax=Plasticicumulans acidivorans TaxID=886464 RepID=A0A317MTW0_9GAMM|nr:dipeptide ABC transporter ATP-binding protein [Plasticicumulans acidivorans]PWV61070.1 dipeptide transport system ATP-binding protein [Plasticicumulans acidivorans]